jgi:hypothetical protein
MADEIKNPTNRVDQRRQWQISCNLARTVGVYMSGRIKEFETEI